MKTLNKKILIFWITQVSFPLMGAKVTEINEKKKLITIDEGSATQKEKDQKICFFNDAGSKITCGKIVEVKETTSNVKIAKSKVGKIKIGMSTEPPSKDGKVSNVRVPFMVVRPFWAGSILNQMTFNRITFKTPEENATEIDSLWQNTGTESMGLLTFGLELELAQYSLAAGFRYRMFQSLSFAADYSTPADTFAVNGNLEASAMGFYLDYYLLKMMNNAFQIGAGVDIDMSTITFDATVVDENAEKDPFTIASASSSLMAISIRAPIRYNITVGMFGLTFGANVMLPIVGTPTLTGEVVDEKYQSLLPVENPIDDLNIALGHQNNGFAFELVGGLFLGF